jgi:glyoxylase-like metal-dependent hydrolase (beta-lactamase superfamily II)
VLKDGDVVEPGGQLTARLTPGHTRGTTTWTTTVETEASPYRVVLAGSTTRTKLVVFPVPSRHRRRLPAFARPWNR